MTIAIFDPVIFDPVIFDTAPPPEPPPTFSVEHDADFDIQQYFTPNITSGFSYGTAWYQPWKLASLNFGQSIDTTPQKYQYIYDRDYADGLRAPITRIDLVKTLNQGSWCEIQMVTNSNRDIFEIVDNEHLTGGIHDGHMLPRMKFPYRTWKVNLKALKDVDFPHIGTRISEPEMFIGQLVDAQVETLSDVAISGQQDGIWRIILTLESMDTFPLRNDVGAPLWYHRLNEVHYPDQDATYLSFTKGDNLTFDQIITKIVAWMNQGRPTKDFPLTYSYTPKGISPYSLSIFDPKPNALVTNLGATATVTFTNDSPTVIGTNTVFLNGLSGIQPGLVAGSLIRLDADNVWVKVKSVESNTSLTLFENYSGTAAAPGNASYNAETMSLINVNGQSTWDILTEVLQYMGSLEGAGKKYIPTLDINGVIDIVLGGFDKQILYGLEDFRSEQTIINANPGTVMTIPFNLINVPFTAVPDKEYWIKFTLYRKNGGGWDTVLTIPPPASGYQGYEYVPYDAYNTKASKNFKFATQDITPEKYKWEADLVTAGSFLVDTPGMAYSPPTYSYMRSPMKLNYRKLKTFVRTRGKCSLRGLYDNTITPSGLQGCKDGGFATKGGNQVCPDQYGCYPDPANGGVGTLTGLIALTLSSKNVVGSGTQFLSELMPGWWIKPVGTSWVLIDSIQDNTHLTLSSVWTGYTIPPPGDPGTFREGVNPIFGILGLETSYADLSNLNVWDTKCRKISKRQYQCHLNIDSSIREPILATIVFNEGYTKNLVGEYLKVYSAEIDDMVIFRCIEQRHIFEKRNIKTQLKAFRI